MSDNKPFNPILAVGGFAVMVALLALVYAFYIPNQVKSADENRAQERLGNLRELEETNREILSRYAWINKELDQVNLPLEQAKKIMVAEWKDSREGKKKLLERLSKTGATVEQTQNRQ